MEHHNVRGRWWGDGVHRIIRRLDFWCSGALKRCQESSKKDSRLINSETSSENRVGAISREDVTASVASGMGSSGVSDAGLSRSGKVRTAGLKK